MISLREAVAQAVGFLVATPEYNHGVPGVMKNAFDWLSRPPGKSVLNGKPSGIVGASPGITRTSRAQSQLRQSFVFTNTPVPLQPEVLVGRVHEKLDSADSLTDEPTRRFLVLFLNECESRAPRGSAGCVEFDANLRNRPLGAGYPLLDLRARHQDALASRITVSPDTKPSARAISPRMPFVASCCEESAFVGRGFICKPNGRYLACRL